MSTPPVVLTIAGTDSGGGAGIAADLATFAAYGVHGTCVVTAVTAQDTTGVHAIHPIPDAIVEAQLRAVLDDLDPAVIKTGMLATAGAVRLVAQACRGRTIVVDPVLRATTGTPLAEDDVVAAYVEDLLPIATVVTPNAEEHRRLGRPHETAVLRTGSGDADELLRPEAEPVPIEHRRIETTNDHGTGCTHASALAACLALGYGLEEAAREAAAYVGRQLATSSTWDLGNGRGPIAHVHTNSIQEDR